ncbi:MAG TPA: CbiX/SirB N-terminal domain-containing protein [Verrucomicrobiae bacterium]|nr:CbiX/SirB N-terminal domain-containing protein [Verrucomicrobiae bacterium]
MNGESFSDAVLVVLGHGTTQNPGSERPVFQHAAELRRRGIFRDVREAFWKQPPQVKDVLAGISAPRIFIVPLFISEGYFAGEVIPRELGFSTINDQPSTVHYCKPVGTHPRMTEVILARAKEVVEQFPFPRAPRPKGITLFIAGHGTEKNEQSRQSIDRQVALIRAREIYADVQAVFLDEDPRIRDCYLLAQTRNLVVVPFFMSDGLHTVEDIPVLLGEPERVVKERLAAGKPTWRNPSEKQGKLIWYSPAVGSALLLAEVILERVRETTLRAKL